MNRREFLSTTAAAAAITTVALEGCSTPEKKQDAEESALGPIPTDQMEYRNGIHGEKISLLGYGCMRWPLLPNDEKQTEGPAAGSNIDQEEVNRLVDYALEHGVNYFDTAPVYCQGYSERVTGIALSRHPRSSYYLATKMSNFDPVLQSLEASKKLYHDSLRYLQTDYIDFYLLHSIGGGGMDNLRRRFFDNGVLDFLLEERKAGRIRNLGFSFHGDIEVFDYMLSRHDEFHWDFVQIQLNYIDWHKEDDSKYKGIDAEYLYKELEKRGIPAVIMEPLLGGRLASLNQHCAGLLKEREPQKSIASWAFRFAGHEPGTLTVLSGMTYMEHLQDNLRTYAPYQDLTEEELALLDKVAHEFVNFPTVPCTGCQYCMPCPYGIDIPGIFKHYNQCLNEGEVEDNMQSAEYKKLRRKYLTSYNANVERERQADHCIGCNQCSSHCPQNIKIPEMLRRIDKFEQTLRESL